VNCPCYSGRPRLALISAGLLFGDLIREEIGRRISLLFESLEVALQLLAHRIQDYVISAPNAMAETASKAAVCRIFTSFDDNMKWDWSSRRDGGDIG